MGTVTKFVYILLAGLLLLEPQIVNDDLFLVSRHYVLTIMNAIILVVAYLLYLVTKRDLARKEREKRVMEMKLTRSHGTLNDAFAYIGILNRRLPLLKNLTTDVVSRGVATKKERKRIFDELLATAVASIVRTEWGMLRFIRVDKEKTTQEFFFTTHSGSNQPHISNHELLSLNEDDAPLKYVDSYCCVATSDRTSPVRCFFIFPPYERTDAQDDMVLQSIVDQAQIFSAYFDRKPQEQPQGEPAIAQEVTKVSV